MYVHTRFRHVIKSDDRTRTARTVLDTGNTSLYTRLRTGSDIRFGLNGRLVGTLLRIFYFFYRLQTHATSSQRDSIRTIEKDQRSISFGAHIPTRIHSVYYTHVRLCIRGFSTVRFFVLPRTGFDENTVLDSPGYSGVIFQTWAKPRNSTRVVPFIITSSSSSSWSLLPSCTSISDTSNA